MRFKRIVLCASLMGCFHASYADTGFFVAQYEQGKPATTLGESFDYLHTLEQSERHELFMVTQEDFDARAIEQMVESLPQYRSAEQDRGASTPDPVSESPSVQTLLVHPLSAPFNDPQFSSQYYWPEFDPREAPGASSITRAALEHAEQDWDRPIRVGVIDSGFHDTPTLNWVEGFSHTVMPDEDSGIEGIGPEFMTSPANTDCNTSHGHQVGSIIASQRDNGFGIAGMLTQAEMVAFRSMGCNGTGLMYDTMRGIYWMAGLENQTDIDDNPMAPISEPVDVINLSLGGTNKQCADFLQEAIDYAVGKDIAVVVAAGNDDHHVSNTHPANCDNVITVGATNADGRKASFSNWGEGVDVSAAGRSLPVEGEDSVVFVSGTSFSSPIVAGMVAMARQRDPQLSQRGLEVLVRATSQAHPFFNTIMGSGVANAHELLTSLDLISQPPEVIVQPATQIHCDSQAIRGLAKQKGIETCALEHIRLGNTERADGRYTVLFDPSESDPDTASGYAVAHSFSGGESVIDRARHDLEGEYIVQVCNDENGVICAFEQGEPITLTPRCEEVETDE